jgi:hypothetical protein
MLSPDARAVLLEELRPPLGFTLDAAVATTFTLELTAALVAPLAFASFEVRGSTDPIAVTEAVRSCTERLDIFCQAGQMAVPAQPSDLMTFLERMVHTVRRPRPGHLFHPKVWVLRYRGPDEWSYRLLCLTRNLTTDCSWDTVLRLDGFATGGPKAFNRPLADFVRALPDLTINGLPYDRTDRILELADEVRHIDWEFPDAVTEIAFHALGLDGPRPTLDFSGSRHLIVAPFINDAGLDVVAPPGSLDVTVVARGEDLDRLPPATIKTITPRILSPLAGLAEPDTDADTSSLPGETNLLGGLHAKFYVVERGRRSHFFIGSANATEAAFGGNVEFLVELVGGRAKLGVDAFLGDDAPFATLLEDYDTSGGSPEDPLETARRTLENLIRALAERRYQTTISKHDDEYDAAVTSATRLPAFGDATVGLELLTRPGESVALASEQRAGAHFGRLPLVDISPFLVIRAQLSVPGGPLVQATVVRAELVGDPPDRLDEILARQVDTPAKFLRFLYLILGLDTSVMHWTAGQGDTTGAWGPIGTTGVFELLCRALATNPNAIRDLARLVTRLQATDAGRRTLPPGFDALWDAVNAAYDRLDATGQLAEVR